MTQSYSFLSIDWINNYILASEEWKLLFLCLILVLFFIIYKIILDESLDIQILLVLVLIGSIILIVADNLLIIYLSLELQTFSIFILIGKRRRLIKSSEASLKYFILGSVASGFFLLGIVTLILSGLPLNLKDLILISKEPITIIPLILVGLSLCFKLTLFPLYFWISDIYEGSSWGVIAIISSLPKISVVVLILQFLIHFEIILVAGIFSIIIGTLGALNQTKIKRLLAYSSINHIGFIMVGYSFLTKQGFIIGNLYVILYMLGVIAIILTIKLSNYDSQYFIEWGDLKLINPTYSITLSLLTLSIAGIPPLSGFILKWFLLLESINTLHNITSFIIVLFSAIGMIYYLRLVKIIYFQKCSAHLQWSEIFKSKREKSTNNYQIILGILFFTVFFLILNVSFLTDLINIISLHSL